MTTARLPPAQPVHLVAWLVATAGLLVPLSRVGTVQTTLFVIGMGLGIALYHASFGFTGAYRRALVERDISGISAQLIMLGVAMVLFAPILAAGQVFGHGVVGAVAPVGVSMVTGALMFGIGMQIAGGCGSGTLFAAGGGSARMLIVLVFFILGTFWGSLDLALWSRLPEFPAISLGERFGWKLAVGGQLAVLALLYAGLRRAGGVNKRPLWWNGGFSPARLVRGPWPLLFSALLLAVLNWATLLVAGHPWSITWGFTLWAAKVAVAIGWDPASSPFWTGGFQAAALARPVLADNTSVMNFGILAGAFLAASLAGRVAPEVRIPIRSLIAAIIGGLLLGYGARLAYGCNIGAFFSGVASTSVHGWAWIAAAVAGNAIGVRLRPRFGLAN